MTGHADKTPARLRLRADRALLHEEGACLPLRSRHGRCTACADACPAGALAVGIEAVSLSDACTGCGRCTAACPTQALALPEIDALRAPPVAASTGMPMRVECRMVPADRLAPGTTVLPCLGALTPGMLLAQAAAGVAVDVIDRGWCRGCPGAGSACADAAETAATTDAAPAAASAALAHPAAAALDAATLWLQAVAAASSAEARASRPTGRPAPTVSLRHEPLPAALRPAALPPPPPPPEPVDRRRFFRAALAKPAGRDRPGAAPMGGDGRAAYPADARHASPERATQLAALQSLAAAHGSAVPAEFFPGLHADARCCDRRMCIALCPTAALTISRRRRCRAAALRPCALHRLRHLRACLPRKRARAGAARRQAETQTLATHRRLRCAECGDVFTPQASAAEPVQAAIEPRLPRISVTSARPVAASTSTRPMAVYMRSMAPPTIPFPMASFVPRDRSASMSSTIPTAGRGR
jgi:ferredoxin